MRRRSRRAGTLVSIIMSSPSLQPDEVTRLLRIQPTKCVAIGEPNAAGRPARVGVWRMEVSAEHGVQAAISELLDSFRDKELAFCELALRYRATRTLAVWWEPLRGEEGFELTPEVISRLARLVTSVQCYYP